MKHAGPAAFDRLDQLLALLRRRADLAEKRPGVFYRRGRAFLHFHEDPLGLFADIRAGELWERLPVNDADEHARLIEAVDRAFAEVAPRT
ncbi:MAG TPA: hypothetical protein VKQ29_02880 [Aliidongia sp.]|nr:hypothetical protein [Aliidongia sp.]